MNFRKISCFIFSFFLLFNFIFADKMPVNTTTKSPEAKKAVDELKKNPSGKSEDDIIIVYNEDFEKGEELFVLNKPEQAISYFEKALESENIDPNVYVYLGICYYQIEQYDKSLEICVKGLAREDTNHKILAYNAGNSCYAMGNYMRADASYAIALKEDENYAPAVLNRANAKLKLDYLGDARNNYVKYLELDPESSQRERIETIIRLLDEEIARRANEKPELINPDNFVENEKMEIPPVYEKVVEELPVEKKQISVVENELVKDEAKAPVLPKIVIQKEAEEKVLDTNIENENTVKYSETPKTIKTEKNETPEKQSSELVRDNDEQARFAEEYRLTLEAEKQRLAEEAKKELEAEKERLAEEARKKAEEEANAKLAAEEAEKQRNDDMRLILEVEKGRLQEEARTALEAEKARLQEEFKKNLELEKARLEAEEAKKSLETERARLEEEAKIALEEEKAKLAEESRKELESEKARLAEEARITIEKEKRRLEEESEKVKVEEELE